MMPQFMLHLTGAEYVCHSSASNQILTPMGEPKQYFVDETTLSLRNLELEEAPIFPINWGQPAHKVVRCFPPIVTRALLYLFYMGNAQGGTSGGHLNAEQICDGLAGLVRAGHINERALTEQQVKSWIGSQKRRNQPRPIWYIPGDPSCI